VASSSQEEFITAMPRKQYFVDLTAEEKSRLESLTRKGKTSAQEVNRARILLLAHQGCSDGGIVKALGVNISTVERLRQRFVEEGFEAALKGKPRPGGKPKLTVQQTAHLTALACSAAPAGHARWNLRLLADKMVELEIVASVSHETVRQTLKKTVSSRGVVRNGVSPAWARTS